MREKLTDVKYEAALFGILPLKINRGFSSYAI